MEDTQTHSDLESLGFSSATKKIDFDVGLKLQSSDKKFHYIQPQNGQSNVTVLLDGSSSDVYCEIPSIAFNPYNVHVAFSSALNANNTNGTYMGYRCTVPWTQIQCGTSANPSLLFHMTNSVMDMTQLMSSSLNKKSWLNNGPEGMVYNERSILAPVHVPTAPPAPLNTALAFADLPAAAAAVNATNTAVNLINTTLYATNNLGFEAGHVRSFINANSTTVLPWYFRLGDIYPMSIFNVNKVINFGEVIRLRFLLQPQFWVGSNAANGSIAGATSVNFTNFQLVLKYEQNEVVKEILNKQISSSEGLSYTFPFMRVETAQRVGQGLHSIEYDNNSSYGLTCLYVDTICSSAKTNLVFDLTNTSAAFTNYMYYINSQPLYVNNLTALESYINNQDFLTDTTLFSQSLFNRNTNLIHNWTEDLYEPDFNAMQQLRLDNIQGLPLSNTSNVKIGIQLNIPDGNVRNYITTFVYLKTIHISNNKSLEVR